MSAEPQTALQALEALVAEAAGEPGVHSWVAGNLTCHDGWIWAERVRLLPNGRILNEWTPGGPANILPWDNLQDWSVYDNRTMDVAKELLRLAGKLPGQESPACTWTEAAAGSDIYETSCGRSWEFHIGGPQANGVRFCPFCGLGVHEAPGERRS